MRVLFALITLSLFGCSSPSKAPQLSDASPQAFKQIIDIDARNNGFANPIRVWLEPGIYQVDPITPAQGGKFTARHAWAGENEGCDRFGIDCLQGWQWSTIVYATDVTLSPLNRRFYNGKPIVWIPGDAILNMPAPTIFAPRATPELAHVFAPKGERFQVKNAGFVLFFDVDRQTYDNLGGVSFLLSNVTLDGPDSDGDMYADSEDAFPNDATARLDSDGDGYPDRWTLGQENSPHVLTVDGFPYDATRHQTQILNID